MNEQQIKTWHEVLQAGEVLAVDVMSGIAIAEAQGTEKEARARLIFPGAFNPLHNGHRAMADVAAELSGGEVEFEISIANVDKAALTESDIRGRLQQFPPTQTVWLTRAERFTQKAEIFPDSMFIVGVDTIARVADVRYYDDEYSPASAIETVATHGCRFMVFGRCIDDEFLTLGSIEIPKRLRQLCIEVPATRFRNDVSSTELRIAGGDRGD